jgi:hypothetical protein
LMWRSMVKHHPTPIRDLKLSSRGLRLGRLGGEKA